VGREGPLELVRFAQQRTVPRDAARKHCRLTVTSTISISTDRGLANGTIWQRCMWLKGVVLRAHYNGKIPRNPFAQFHISPNCKERAYLTSYHCGCHSFATIALTNGMPIESVSRVLAHIAGAS